MRLVPFHDSDATWDAAVARDPAATFCHLAAWRAIMADVLGCEPLYTVAVDDTGRWCGMLPLVRVRSALFGDYLVSLPFLNYGGPLGGPETQRALADHAAETAQRLGADLLELRTRADVGCDLRLSHRRITVLLDLPPCADTLWEGFSAKLRAQVRRPRTAGMEPRFGVGQVAAFYDVFARTMRQLGTPVLSRTLFERLARDFPALVVFGAVYWRHRPVAAGCGFVWQGEFELTWAAALHEHRRAAPNMLLYWSFMEHLIALGVRVFNFGRCTPGGGTHRFKQQWGGRDVPLPWRQWSSRSVVATPAPTTPRYRLAAAVWRRLPLGVTNRIGPLLARRLP